MQLSNRSYAQWKRSPWIYSYRAFEEAGIEIDYISGQAWDQLLVCFMWQEKRFKKITEG